MFEEKVCDDAIYSKKAVWEMKFGTSKESAGVVKASSGSTSLIGVVSVFSVSFSFSCCEELFSFNFPYFPSVCESDVAQWGTKGSSFNIYLNT